jgi:hypothetical protein
MTLTHLPTHLSDLVNEPFGFVSSAEGFVFLSALLVARLSRDPARVRLHHGRRLRRDSAQACADQPAQLLSRTSVPRNRRLASADLLPAAARHLADVRDFSADHAISTCHCDTPRLERHPAGQRVCLVACAVGLRAWVHDVVVHVTTLQIPLQDTGSFNLFAWQMVWVSGLCIGAISGQEGRSFRRPPRFVYQVSALICIFFIGVRHNWLGNHLTQQMLGMQLDKWQLGPLRLVNLIAFACVIYWSRKLLTRLFLIEPFIMLGKASLQVFCAHLAFVFVGLALLYGTVSQLHGFDAVGLVALTFVGLIFVALRKTRCERQEQTPNNPELKINPPATYRLGLTGD